MVAPTGIEPVTQGFSVLCSTDWAMEPKWRFVRDLNPWSLAWQASVIGLYTNEPLVAGAGFEPTAFGLWAQRATRLLHPAIIYWRRKRDSNPCADCSTCRFSRPIPSAGLGYSSIYIFPTHLDYNKSNKRCQPVFKMLFQKLE